MNIVFDEEEINLDFSGSLKSLLKQLGINPHTVVVARDQEIISIDTELKNSDDIEIIPVVLGG